MNNKLKNAVAIMMIILMTTVITVVVIGVMNSVDEQIKNINMNRDYQVEITDDSTYIYDDDRLVGVIPFDSTAAFDKIMLKDNQ